MPSRADITGRHATLPGIQPIKTRLEHAPDDDDESAEAYQFRARWGYQMGLAGKAALGRPARTNADGSTSPATGLWMILEPIREMADDYRTQREASKATKRTAGSWLADRGTKLVDTWLGPALLFLGYFLLRHFNW
jgi:hypothetical protein